MKRLTVLCLMLLVLFNLVTIQPAWADRPKLANNPDYQELTQTLNSLIEAKNNNAPPEGLTLADLQQQISDLRFQKYILETGKKHASCSNQTQEGLLVYGDKVKHSFSPYDNDLYILPAGEVSDDDWNCEGIYVPKDVKITDLTITEPIAAKIVRGTKLVITDNPKTGALELNAPLAKIFKAGEVNWEIPDISKSEVAGKFPTVPND